MNDILQNDIKNFYNKKIIDDNYKKYFYKKIFDSLIKKGNLQTNNLKELEIYVYEGIELNENSNLFEE